MIKKTDEDNKEKSILFLLFGFFLFLNLSSAIQIIVDSPTNDSEFNLNTTSKIFGINISNATNYNIYIYNLLANYSTNNFYDFLVYKQLNVLAGTNTTFNLTISPTNHTMDGLVALWHFDNRSEYGENDTYVVDYAWNQYKHNFSRYGNNAGVSNSSKLGYAYNFSGSALATNDSTDLNFSSFTVSFWMNARGINNDIIRQWEGADQQRSWAFGLNSIGNLAFLVANGSNSFDVGSALPSINEWHFVAGVYNGSVATLYVNNDQKGNTTKSILGIVPFDSNASIRIADNFIFPGNYNGTLDELAIFNKTLTPTEISNLYRQQAGRYYFKVNVTSGAEDNESVTYSYSILDGGATTTSTSSTSSTTAESDTSGITGGGSRTGSSLKAIRFTASLPLIWQPSNITNIFIKVYDQNNAPYSPKNITSIITPNYNFKKLSLVEYTIGNFTLKYKTEDSPFGNYSLLLIVEDLNNTYNFQILEGREITAIEQVKNTISKGLSQENREILKWILIIIGTIILTIILIWIIYLGFFKKGK